MGLLSSNIVDFLLSLNVKRIMKVDLVKLHISFISICYCFVSEMPSSKLVI